MWMATREQVKTFNLTCNEPLFPPGGAGKALFRNILSLNDHGLITVCLSVLILIQQDGWSTGQVRVIMCGLSHPLPSVGPST